MRRPNNWDNVRAAGEREKLPAGGYEAQIINAKVASYTGQNGAYERLEIAVDIISSDYKDYFKEDYDNNPREDRKWKGVARFYVPTDDGSDSDEYTKSVLRSVTDALEASNKGYTWNWDEKSLKGLKVGILVRDKEYEIEDKHGFAPEIFRFIGIDRIQSGRFTVPKPKLIKRDETVPAAPPAASAPQTAPVADFTGAGRDPYPF